MPRFARVILDRSTGGELDYEIPERLRAEIAEGSRVRVPLRNRQVVGTVVSVSDTTSVKGVRPIAAALDKRPQMTPVLMRLAKWMAEYYGCEEKDALRSVLPRAVREAGHAPLRRKCVAPARPVSEDELDVMRKKAPRQAAVIERLRTSDGPMPAAVLEAEVGASAATLKALEKRGLLVISNEEIRRTPIASQEFVATQPPELSREQERALEGLRPALANPSAHRPVVLKGVTGSGKTEVYLRAIGETLDAGKTAIVLVPEIALTPQTVERFSSRFTPRGIEVAVLHSHLSEGERHDEWHRVRDGRARIVIGARGAIFAPLSNLGLIVVDEEHDTSYKQDEAPRYNARDLAVVRGKLEPCAVLLGSATPSLESFENCRSGKYSLLELTHRHDGCTLPVFRVVDMRLRGGDGRSDQFLSPKLCAAIESRLAKGQQTILFLNRRGFFTVLACKACGESVQCPHCSVSLALHKSENSARCHLCGHAEKPPRRCPQCRDPQIAFSGVGTEKVEAAVRKIFPQARVARMDSDTMQKKSSYHDTLGAFRARKIDILVGTQMIAKGLHFPGVTLVGIISADSALHLPDFRAGERTFQLLVQVAGRAGRGDAEGEVIVQTFTPFHSSLQFAKTHDFDGFAEQELELRRNFGQPPFSHVVLITTRADTVQKAEFIARMLAQKLSAAVPPSVMVSPAAPAPLARVRGMYRYQIVARGRQIRALTKAVRETIAAIKLPKGAYIAVDVDPTALL